MLLLTLTKKILGSRKTVFSAEQEEELVNYILDMEVRMYGLTTHDVRSLAYQLAERNGIANHPFSLENKIAGRDWLFGFQKRHPGLSLRVPEATSVARAKAFNKPVVSKFFDLLKAEYQKHNYPAHRIYNVDETSLSTVPGRNSKTFAKKGRKQVGRVTSAERGQSSTAVICMSAGGIFVPPMIIFSRKRMKPELKDGAPPGTIFACNESGWMKEEVFSLWFEHFLSFAKPSPEDPVLLILDGHLSHTKNLNVIVKAKDNFVSILCLPPHCTHKLQPLDVGIMFPLSTAVDHALERWLNNNPGRTITTFQISKIFCEGYLKACTPANAINAFKKTGIVPYNSGIFNDLDFIAAETTDEKETTEIELSENVEANATDLGEASTSNTSPNKTEDVEIDKTHDTSFTKAGPITLRPLPKISGPRAQRKRKSVGTVLLTSTPYKDNLTEEKKQKAAKEETRKNKKGKCNPKKSKKGPPKKLAESSSEESEQENGALCIYCSEPYGNSIEGEGWIQCSRCRQWAHDACAGIDENAWDDFICDLCLTNSSHNANSSKRLLKF
jgi:hypothetical protein